MLKPLLGVGLVPVSIWNGSEADAPVQNKYQYYVQLRRADGTGIDLDFGHDGNFLCIRKAEDSTWKQIQLVQ